MAENTRASLKGHIDKLVRHLEHENPELLAVVKTFRRLDKVSYKLGLLDQTESYAEDVTWWPLISVLGTFSSGKSTFINDLLGAKLQTTGNQAVDDKFTVICYGGKDKPQTLPGLALDSDPRFPFYKISRDIEEALEGEGSRLDTYLQLKTCPSQELRGKIVIDSPGFDADDQRNATLRITNHIINLSDLVLVFFDARHPEPGAMTDTLEYLVAGPLHRPDFNKFMYILNQIDNAAREDNPEEVFAAWQRALGQKGHTTGRFYRIYNRSAAIPIEDEGLRARFEAKRDEDMAEIEKRISELDVQRSYRVAGKLEQTAKEVRDELVPKLTAARRAWRKRLLWLDGIVFGAGLLALLVLSAALGYWQGLSFEAPWFAYLSARPLLLWAVVIVIAAGLFQLHRELRRLAGRSVLKNLQKASTPGATSERLANAFERNICSWRPVLMDRPVGWGPLSARRLDAILSDADRSIQALNDRYADPSGNRSAQGG
ncbi:dynamin family protein [Pseudohaliea sp.]|uniref:dynamin family protein n=1 Tax=Pseudohaliea sp. TaxID=2740289 RepID=UPI0032EAC564